MKLWPWSRRRPETRSSGYTATLINAAVDAAAGAGGDVASRDRGRRGGGGAVEQAALPRHRPPGEPADRGDHGLAARPGGPRARHPRRGHLRYPCCRRRHPASYRRRRCSPLPATPTRRHGITCSTINGPTGGRSYSRPRAAVCHLLYGQTSAASWRGVPPWASASLSGRLLAGVERQLAGEARLAASGYFLLSVPDTGDRGAAAADD